MAHFYGGASVLALEEIAPAWFAEVLAICAAHAQVDSALDRDAGDVDRERRF